MGKIKLKNKTKKNLNTKPIKFLFSLFIVLVSSFFTLTYLINNTSNITKEEYVDYLLNKINNKNTNNFIVNESIKLLSNIDLNNPSTLLDKKLKNNENTIYTLKQEKDAKAQEDNYDENVYNKITSYIENNTSEKDNPIIYLYNSHQLETYSNQGFENNNITPNVLMTSYLLSEELNKQGIPTIVEDTNISEFIKMSNLSSDSFYASTRIFLKNTMNKYQTVKYFVDIHRDSVTKNISTTSIDNKNYARVLFVLGTTNPKYKENEKIMLSLDSLLDKYYPNLSRGIYNRPTPSWPDSYNQDLNSGVILIEVGGKENTIEEVSNTVLALSDVIKKYIKGEVK